MDITAATPAEILNHTIRKPNRRRHYWTPLVAALRIVEHGTWLSIPLSHLPGNTTAQKQAALISVVNRYFGRAQTQTDKTHLFVVVPQVRGTDNQFGQARSMNPHV